MRTKKKFLVIIFALLGIGIITLFDFLSKPSLAPSSAEPAEVISLDQPTATPAVISVGERNLVTIQVWITDPRLIPSSVNLQRLDANGNVVSTLGNLRDDGYNGDRIAADKIYSLQVSFEELNQKKIPLRVTAAYERILKRIFSPTFFITAIANTQNSSTWAEYRNQTFHYIFRFPSDIFAINNEKPGSISLDSSLRLENNVSLLNIVINTYLNPDHLELNEFLASSNAFLSYGEFQALQEELGEAAGSYTEEPIIVNGLVGLKQITVLEGGWQERLFFSSGDFIYVMEVGSILFNIEDVEIKKLLNLFETIASTFSLL